MTASARVEAAVQQAARRVIGREPLEQVVNLLDAGFAAMAAEFDRRDDVDFDDAIATIRRMVDLLDGPVSEEAQKAQDIGREALKRLAREAS